MITCNTDSVIKFIETLVENAIAEGKIDREAKTQWVEMAGSTSVPSEPTVSLYCVRSNADVLDVTPVFLSLDGTYFLVCIFSDIFLNQFYLHDWETRTCR